MRGREHDGAMTMQESLPAAGVVRLSRGSFDPTRFAEIEQATDRTRGYLIPAIRQLPGVQAYFAGVSPSGSVINVSFWDTPERADQMSRLPEMIVRARQEYEPFTVSFIPIVNYPIMWRI